MLLTYRAVKDVFPKGKVKVKILSAMLSPIFKKLSSLNRGKNGKSAGSLESGRKYFVVLKN